MSFEIQIATLDDLDQIRLLFFETINQVNVTDYSSSQIQTWSAGYNDVERWKTRLLEQYFIVARIDSLILGFASLTPGGCLDCMYVHKNYQRQGVASMLLDDIERYALETSMPEIWSDVSITAKPFFLKRGFTIENLYVKQLQGVSFDNTIMKKRFG